MGDKPIKNKKNEINPTPFQTFALLYEIHTDMSDANCADVS